MTIWERTKAALDTTGLDCAQSVYLSATAAARPDQYLVYFLVTAPAQQHADNAETLREMTMQVSLYSRTGFTDTLIDAVHNAMTAAGFTAGPRRELPYAEDTRHFGLVFEFTYLEERTV
jgi:hypothetical protein